jgi:molybdopterin molybdotransferase
MNDSSSISDDVRMRGFARRTTVAEALAWLDRHVRPLPEEAMPPGDAAGRVLASSITSAVDVPSFVRAMMDGFAVRAADTLGASPYNRLSLEIIGDSMPGRPCERSVGRGEAVRIMTGAPLPEGADAVLPAEFAESDANRVWAHGEVPPQRHVGRIGEDIAAGTPVLPAGRVLRPQDLGVLSSIGAGQVPLVRRPRVEIVVTGNELLPAGTPPGAAGGLSEAGAAGVSPVAGSSTGKMPVPPDRYKIADANGPMLSALAARDGGIPHSPGIVPDDPEAVLSAMRAPADVVLVSGGSSVGQEDYAPMLLARHGQLAIHGIAMRPSSPTGMGVLDGRLVFLLPGNPVSCLAAYDFFAGRAIRGLGGRPLAWPYRRIAAPLAKKVASAIGRLEYLRVRLVEGRVEPLAVGGASILSSTTRADGFVIVPDDSEGYPAETQVEVFLYD